MRRRERSRTDCERNDLGDRRSTTGPAGRWQRQANSMGPSSQICQALARHRKDCGTSFSQRRTAGQTRVVLSISRQVVDALSASLGADSAPGSSRNRSIGIGTYRRRGSRVFDFRRRAQDHAVARR